MIFFFVAEKDSGGFRAGKRQRQFPKSLKFFDMPRVFTAGIAEHIFARFAVDITEIIFVQKCTAFLIMTERMFLPVDVIQKAVAKSSFAVAVFFETVLIDHDLPAGTAGIRTAACDAGKFITKSRFRDLHNSSPEGCKFYLEL